MVVVPWFLVVVRFRRCLKERVTFVCQIVKLQARGSWFGASFAWVG